MLHEKFESLRKRHAEDKRKLEDRRQNLEDEMSSFYAKEWVSLFCFYLENYNYFQHKIYVSFLASSLGYKSMLKRNFYHQSFLRYKAK